MLDLLVVMGFAREQLMQQKTVDDIIYFPRFTLYVVSCWFYWLLFVYRTLFVYQLSKL